VVAGAKGNKEDCKLGVARIGWCRNSVAESRFSGKSVWDLQRQHWRGERERVVGRAAGRGNGGALAAGNGRGIRRWLRDALPADQRWPVSSRSSVGLVGSARWNAGCRGAGPAQGSIARHRLERAGWGRNCCGVPDPTPHGWRGLGARGRASAAGASRRLGLNGGVCGSCGIVASSTKADRRQTATFRRGCPPNS
jgi:hypothetical protein